MKKKPIQCPECQNNEIITLPASHKSPACKIISTILTATLILIIIAYIICILNNLRIVTYTNPETGDMIHRYLFESNKNNSPFGDFIATFPNILLVINILSLITVKIIQHILESYIDSKFVCKECGYTWTQTD